MKLHLGLPKPNELALILKHLLRRYFCLVTDDQYLLLGQMASGFSGGDLEVVVYEIINQKEGARLSSTFVQECPIRSDPYRPVWVPCGPHAKNAVRMSTKARARLGQFVEKQPITFRCVRVAIHQHTKTVPQRLVDYHLSYSKDNDFKPPKETHTVTHVLQHEKK